MAKGGNEVCGRNAGTEYCTLHMLQRSRALERMFRLGLGSTERENKVGIKYIGIKCDKVCKGGGFWPLVTHNLAPESYQYILAYSRSLYCFSEFKFLKIFLIKMFNRKIG